jgi:hypothetical protein
LGGIIILTSELNWGIIDLHKQSAVPLRVALQTNGHEGLTNPHAGSYKLINGREGFIFNTGFPFGIPGSAKPQHLSLKAGNLSFLNVMEDVFAKACWLSPRRTGAIRCRSASN